MALFSESASRAVVSFPESSVERMVTVAEEHGVPLARIGEVLAEPQVQVAGLFDLPLAELREVWATPIPQAMKH